MSQRYEIVICEHLSPQWVTLLEGMEIVSLPNGGTRLTGSLPDQSALYGLLMRLRDLGIKLVSVNPIEPKEEK